MPKKVVRSRSDTARLIDRKQHVMRQPRRRCVVGSLHPPAPSENRAVCCAHVHGSAKPVGMMSHCFVCIFSPTPGLIGTTTRMKRSIVVVVQQPLPLLAARCCSSSLLLDWEESPPPPDYPGPEVQIGRLASIAWVSLCVQGVCVHVLVTWRSCLLLLLFLAAEERLHVFYLDR